MTTIFISLLFASSSDAFTHSHVGPRQRVVARASSTPIFELSKSQKQVDGQRIVSAEGSALLKECQKSLSDISKLESELEAMSDVELRNALKDDMTTVFGVVREAAWRVLQMRPYDVQMLGGLVMARGGLAEMATGEGKTLAAVAPVVYHALKKKGSLVVTTNDYLARRDADSVGQIARFLGLSVGLVESSLSPAERRDAYACDITYVSNSELGFDYLRDNLAFSSEEVVLREQFGFALIDEADSILIDDAKTPLVVSEQVVAPTEKYAIAKELVDGVLRETVHYDVDLKKSAVTLTEIGYKECLATLGVTDLADPQTPWAPYISNALRAKALLEKDRDYVIREGGEVAIVDAFSGRILEGRRWSDGLQQAVEAKENLPASNLTRPAATVTFQALFGGGNRRRLCDVLSGMTGTASTDADEFESVYNLVVAPVPTALPVARKDYEDAVYATVEAKWRAAAAEVARAHKTGRPVLVGTSSIEDSEDFAKRLAENYGIFARTLNARPDAAKAEGAVVAGAGRLGAITVATNMAGRGTDIVLGGDAKFIVKSYLENKLAGGDDDEFDLPVDDEIKLELDEAAKEALELLLSDGDEKKLSSDEAAQVAAAAVESSKGAAALSRLRSASRAARTSVAESLAEEREKVLELGGLYVIGTQRHESRRVDRQLRGRSGRQGDPGASRFFVSVEDDIFKRFGGDKIKSLMRTLRVGEDLPVEAKAVTEALARIQEQVEKYNGELRSTTLTFDEVLDVQRRQIYSWRSRILAKRNVRAMCKAWTATTAASVVASVKRDKGDADMLRARFGQIFVASSQAYLPDANLVDLIKAPDFLGGDDDDEEEEAVDQTLCLFGLDVDATCERIEKIRSAGPATDAFAALAILQIDKLWADHLTNINDLKESIQFRAYAGTQPTDEFQQDAFVLYRKLRAKIKTDTTYSFFQLLLKGK